MEKDNKGRFVKKQEPLISDEVVLENTPLEANEEVIEKDENGMIEVDLGDRVVEVEGKFYTKTICTSNVEFAKKLIEGLKKPKEFTVNLGNLKIQVGTVIYSGVVSVIDKDIYHELNYRKSQHEVGQKRLQTANSGHPRQFVGIDQKDKVSLVINGSDFVRAN